MKKLVHLSWLIHLPTALPLTRAQAQAAATQTATKDDWSLPNCVKRMPGRALSALGLLLGLTAPALAQTKAVPADRLLETIGIGSRFDWKFDDYQEAGTATAINAIGFRHMRIGLGAQLEQRSWAAYQAYWASYAQQRGVKLLLQIDGYDPQAMLTEQFNKWMETPGVVWGVEGANETYVNANWGTNPPFANAFELQKFIYGLARPRGLNVLTWTTGGGALPYVESLPNPNAYCTHANFHAYSWDTNLNDGRKTIPIWQDYSLNNETVSWGADVSNYGHVGALWAMDRWTGNVGKPKTISEWGFTWEATGSEDYFNIDSEWSRAKYIARNSLELVNAGVDKAYIYSLLDENDKFGIANYDGSLKQSGQGLANLFALLTDQGHANDATGSLDYTLTTASGIGTVDDRYVETDEIHQTLFQKSNGHFILALWADKDSHRGETGSEAATLRLNGITASEVKIYLPLGSSGTTAVQTLPAGTTSIDLSGAVAIPDHPLLLDITPGGPAATTPPTASTGSVMRELWLNAGSTTAVSSIPVSTTPSSTSTLTSLEGPSNAGDAYGDRIRGYIVPTATGSHTFYLAGDDNSELWLSPSDQPGSKVRIASVTGWTNSRQWTKYSSQISAAQTLTAGQRYYFEVLHKEGGGGDNLAVGWTRPGNATISVIGAANLAPYPTTLASTSTKTTSAQLVATRATDELAATEDASLTAYPNPSPDGRPTLRLTAPTAQKATVLVVDALGRTLTRLEQAVPAGSTDLTLPLKLPAGLYFLQTTLGGRVLHSTLRVE